MWSGCPTQQTLYPESCHQMALMLPSQLYGDSAEAGERKKVCFVIVPSFFTSLATSWWGRQASRADYEKAPWQPASRSFLA